MFNKIWKLSPNDYYLQRSSEMRTNDQDEAINVKGVTDGIIWHPTSPKYQILKWPTIPAIMWTGPNTEASRSATASETKKTSLLDCLLFFITVT